MRLKGSLRQSRPGVEVGLARTALTHDKRLPARRRKLAAWTGCSRTDRCSHRGCPSCRQGSSPAIWSGGGGRGEWPWTTPRTCLATSTTGQRMGASGGDGRFPGCDSAPGRPHERDRRSGPGRRAPRARRSRAQLRADRDHRRARSRRSTGRVWTYRGLPAARERAARGSDEGRLVVAHSYRDGVLAAFEPPRPTSAVRVDDRSRSATRRARGRLCGLARGAADAQLSAPVRPRRPAAPTAPVAAGPRRRPAAPRRRACRPPRPPSVPLSGSGRCTCPWSCGPRRRSPRRPRRGSDPCGRRPRPGPAWRGS